MKIDSMSILMKRKSLSSREAGKNLASKDKRCQFSKSAKLYNLVEVSHHAVATTNNRVMMTMAQLLIRIDQIRGRRSQNSAKIAKLENTKSKIV